MTVIKLTTPITHGEKTLTELTIAAPTAKQIRESGCLFGCRLMSAAVILR